MLYNGTFTLTNEAGEHKTFQVKTWGEDHPFAPGARVISLMTGSDNEKHYTGLGWVNDNGIKLWAKRANKVNDYLTKLLWAAGEAIEQTEDVQLETSFEFSGRKYTVLLAKKCLKCNRKLTTPDSIRTGIGPICAGKVA